jgi:N12 class adenine-specific DNA methylase
VARARANLTALTTLRAIQQEGRPPTAEEQQVLARWSGWGAVPEVFDPGRADYQWAREQLADLLSPQEMAAAARNTLNAHYTDAAIVQAVWGAVRDLGFTGGRVLEPGCGSGNFIAFAPGTAQMTGVEVDPVTAGIAAALHPHAQILPESFAATRDPDGCYDLAIGNVPFGKAALLDKRHNPAGHSIHNHFIIKSLHLVRPGGLVAVLTSRYTMDARNPAARRDIAALADLVGAVRLPSGAHQRAAGTSVVTDLLILRRREPGREPDATSWEQARMIEVDSVQVPVSEYFLDHPENVLGEMSGVSGAYRAGDLTVSPSDDTQGDLTRALGAVVTDARQRGLAWTPGVAPEPVAVDDGRSEQMEGYLSAADDGTFTRVKDGFERPHQVPRSQAAELRHLLSLRDTARALLDAEASSAEDTAQIGQLRRHLDRRYDAYLAAYGPLNRYSERRTGRTNPNTGQQIMARIRPPQGGFRDDPFAPLVYALEEFDPAGQRAAKTAIFRQRVVAPRAPRLGADTPADALAICLDTHGRADLAEIARLLGITEQDARQQLDTLVFNDPASGQLVPAAEYLSGQVRDKLRAAGQAAADDPRFTVNVTELRKAQPPDLTPGEIDARLGAAWISANHVQQFLRETLDDPRLQVEHPGGQLWAVRGNDHTVLAASTWGTSRYPAPALAQAILEQRRVEVRDTIRTPDGERRVLNVEDTLAAQEKAAELGERFAEWAWQDPDRATDLARTYNERFNNLVLRSYDDAKLSLPGLSEAFRPRPHQTAAVARMIHEPSVGLFHEVGAGKTAEMIMGVAELRRLGLVRKPAVVVPNHMLEQFAREWLQLYPQARVLVAGREDLQRDRRRAFVARCATGDWDGIVISRSAFEKIPLSPAEQQAYLDRELDLWRKWLTAARESESGGGGLTVKRLEGALLRAEERLKAKLDSAKDPGITFEATGIDYLCIDEAHGYKNLRTLSNIPDAAIDGSMRASDLDMKIGYLRRRNGARVVTFATATPIANSVTEAYVMQRYLRPDLLEAAGIEVFDTWAATFGEVVTQVELAPEGGSSFRMKSRFAKFRNVPEMLRMLHVCADIKTAEDLNLPVPDIATRDDGQRAPQTVTVEPSPELLSYVDDLGKRAEMVHNRMVGPEEDNMLKISGDGRRAALDLRLAGLSQETPGKAEAAAGKIAAIWQDCRDRSYLAPDGRAYPARGALQLVFCDLGTPVDGWNVYDELRTQLAARGVPREAVRFIHEAKTDRDKAQLFAACRSGRVAVLVGSTEKMGVGTNVQDRAIALHHLDAPWRPADVAQREGRIVRQGNLNPEVEIYRWVTEGSFDGYMWQTLERKARFISQVIRGRLDAREIGDVGDTALSYSEVKALATGNPLLMDKADADAALARLQRSERAHGRNQNALRHAIARHQQDITRLTGLIGDIDAAIGRRQDTRGDRFAMTVDGRAHGKRATAGQHLKHLLQRQAAELDGPRTSTATPGHLGGFPVTATAGRVLGKTTITLGLDGAPGTSIRLDEQELSQADPAGLITRLENRLARLEEEKAGALAGIGRAQLEIAHAHDSIGKPFPQAGQLAAARERARRINDELDQMAAPAQAEGQPSAESAPVGDPAASEPASLSAPTPAARQESPTLPPGPARDPARQASREAPDPGNGRHPEAGQARGATADPRAAAETAQPHEHTQDRDAAATAAPAEVPTPARYGARYPGSRPERQHSPQAETTPADPEAGS